MTEVTLTWHDNDVDVKIGGSFNDWKLIPMKKEGDKWIHTIKLKKGTYHYKFFVDNKWFFNPLEPTAKK